MSVMFGYLKIIFALLFCGKQAIDFEISITERYFEVKSNQASFFCHDDALCASVQLGKIESFLYIGQSEEKIRSDPDFEKVNQEHPIRFLNPFKPNTFEPQNAEQVVRFYLLKTHEKLRSGGGDFGRRLLRLFCYDSFDVSLSIEGYDQVPLEKRNNFETHVRKIPGVRKLTVSSK
jgi:hypothetical protein